MTFATAYYSRAHARTGVPLASAEELDALLLHLSTQTRRIFVQVYFEDDPDMPEFAIGIDGDHGALYYSGRNHIGVWYTHNPAITSIGLTDYENSDTAIEMPDNARLPLTQIRAAAAEFFHSHGDRPTSVAWREQA
ncbi:Imm1 family immunity protein [Actinokineospora inagensis]|uniref:Imm1 family immunity protein n=1 Tax=Actinokineospora inagensis TaxID=103730 RepID=UPI00146FA91A|nr:Imm1 family immunity protein [Actinokineospora inagensis]